MMQGVSLRPDQPLGLPSRYAQPARPAGAGQFTPPAPDPTSADFIDVEVLWEDSEPAPDVTWRRTPAPRPSQPPLRITTASDAIDAYRSASSTRTLPHTLVDLFA
jgi:hypothetical protein